MARLVLLLLNCLALAGAFSVTGGALHRSPAAAAAAGRRTSCISAVDQIMSQSEFDKIIADAGDSLVVIDFATSWCGPCKIIAPKFEEMSKEFTGAQFYKVMGDTNKETDALMRGQGVRALPTFQLWKGGELINSISGAKTEPLRQAIQAGL